MATEPYVDAGPVRQHLEMLRAAGMGIDAIAAHGVAPNTARYILRGTARRCQAGTARAILQIPVRPFAEGRVSAVSTQRRLGALMAIGYDATFIAGVSGMSAQNVRLIFARHDVTVRTRDIFSELYDRLCLTPGPSLSARRWAKRHAWPPPMAWDDDELDDPDETVRVRAWGRVRSSG